MRTTYWLAAIAGLILLGLAFILTGGVYRTVNAGGARVYIVNRFTGRTWGITSSGKREVGRRQPSAGQSARRPSPDASLLYFSIRTATPTLDVMHAPLCVAGEELVTMMQGSQTPFRLLYLGTSKDRLLRLRCTQDDLGGPEDDTTELTFDLGQRLPADIAVGWPRVGGPLVLKVLSITPRGIVTELVNPEPTDPQYQPNSFKGWVRDWTP